MMEVWGNVISENGEDDETIEAQHSCGRMLYRYGQESVFGQSLSCVKVNVASCSLKGSQ